MHICVLHYFTRATLGTHILPTKIWTPINLDHERLRSHGAKTGKFRTAVVAKKDESAVMVVENIY